MRIDVNTRSGSGAVILPRSNSSRRAIACAAALLIVVSAVPASAQVAIFPHFYRLNASPLVPAPGRPTLGVEVSLNPCPLPPGLPDAFLDLTNPGSPVYMQPGVGNAYNEIVWGMNLGGVGTSYSFADTDDDPEPGSPNFRPNSFRFLAQAQGANGDLVGDQFRVSFLIDGPAPIDRGSFVSLNPCPLPPFPDPNINQTVGYQFRFQSATLASMALSVNPQLTFELFNVTQGVPYVFALAATPEPSTLTMMLAGGGIAALLTRWRRKRLGRQAP